MPTPISFPLDYFGYRIHQDENDFYIEKIMPAPSKRIGPFSSLDLGKNKVNQLRAEARAVMPKRS